jgi:molybdopterin/thiamine biosynthesis adenylyltransferase
MRIQEVKATSRPNGVAEMLIGHPVNREEVLRKKVVLTCELGALATQNGRWCFLDCLRLLPRLVGHLTVLIPDGLGIFEQEVRSLVGTVRRVGSLELLQHRDDADFDDVSAILCVGFESNPQLPWTTINSNGWVARVASSGEALPRDMEQSNPIGALMAASFGVTETFKRLYGVPPEVVPVVRLVEFSLYDLKTSPNDVGPKLPDDITIPDTLIVGAGAIGNGVALLLSQLKLKGRLHIVDKQAYGEENFGTCTLLDGADWLNSSKAECIARWLEQRSDLHVTAEQGLVANARSGAVVSSMVVDLVLNGLDDVAARHDVQMLWPTTLVDGGINAIGAGVVTHRLDHPEGACLRCTFSLPSQDDRELQSKATGLSKASLTTNLDRPLTGADVDQAEEAKRPWLITKLAEGKTICATITEAQSEKQLGVELEDGFRPSAPFVATASAALMVAEALKALLYPEAVFSQSFQIANLFLGPTSSVASLRRPSQACECVTQREIIDRLAEKRLSTNPKEVGQSQFPLSKESVS